MHMLYIPINPLTRNKAFTAVPNLVLHVVLTIDSENEVTSKHMCLVMHSTKRGRSFFIRHVII